MVVIVFVEGMAETDEIAFRFVQNVIITGGLHAFGQFPIEVIGEDVGPLPGFDVVAPGEVFPINRVRDLIF